MDITDNSFSIEAEVLTALGHPARLEILEMLRDGERCVCHLQTFLDQRQAYVSQHLNILRRAGLVTSRKDGKRVYYQVPDPRIYTLIDSLQLFLGTQKWHVTQTAAKTAAVSTESHCTCPQCSPAAG